MLKKFIFQQKDREIAFFIFAPCGENRKPASRSGDATEKYFDFGWIFVRFKRNFFCVQRRKRSQKSELPGLIILKKGFYLLTIDKRTCFFQFVLRFVWLISFEKQIKCVGNNGFIKRPFSQNQLPFRQVQALTILHFVHSSLFLRQFVLSYSREDATAPGSDVSGPGYALYGQVDLTKRKWAIEVKKGW